MCAEPTFIVKFCDGTTRKVCSSCLHKVMAETKLVFCVKAI